MQASASLDLGPIRIFRAAYAPADEEMAAEFLAYAPRSSAAEASIYARATRLVEAIRARSGGLGGVDDFLHAYSLSTREGLALMVLAEALLRVPDQVTVDRLIEDKLKAGDWTHHDASSAAVMPVIITTDGDAGRVRILASPRRFASFINRLSPWIRYCRRP